MSMHRGRESVGGDSACRQFGHFHKYAPEKIEYPFERYKMESQRLLEAMAPDLEALEAEVREKDATIAELRERVGQLERPAPRGGGRAKRPRT